MEEEIDLRCTYICQTDRSQPHLVVSLIILAIRHSFQAYVVIQKHHDRYQQISPLKAHGGIGGGTGAKLFDEEEAEPLSSSIDVFNHVFPKQKHWINEIIHFICYGFFLAACMVYLAPGNLRYR